MIFSQEIPNSLKAGIRAISTSYFGLRVVLSGGIVTSSQGIITFRPILNRRLLCQPCGNGAFSLNFKDHSFPEFWAIVFWKLEALLPNER